MLHPVRTSSNHQFECIKNTREKANPENALSVANDGDRLLTTPDGRRMPHPLFPVIGQRRNENVHLHHNQRAQQLKRSRHVAPLIAAPAVVQQERRTLVHQISKGLSLR